MVKGPKSGGKLAGRGNGQGFEAPAVKRPGFVARRSDRPRVANLGSLADIRRRSSRSLFPVEGPAFCSGEHPFGPFPDFGDPDFGGRGEGRGSRRGAGVISSDEPGRPGAAHLAGIEGRASGPVDAVGTVDFADRKEMGDFGFPPDIGGQPAIVMLGADPDFERLAFEVDPMGAE